jgi:hypothetical protein
VLSPVANTAIIETSKLIEFRDNANQLNNNLSKCCSQIYFPFLFDNVTKLSMLSNFKKVWRAFYFFIKSLAKYTYVNFLSVLSLLTFEFYSKYVQTKLKILTQARFQHFWICKFKFQPFRKTFFVFVSWDI